MILKIESSSGLWNPQQLKELSNLMDNSSYVLKFLSDKTVALVVDDSDGEKYTEELKKMGFAVSQDLESVDSLISGTNETKDQKPLTDSEEDMNMNIKDDSNVTKENIPDIHINANDKVESKEEVMIENHKDSSKDLDIKISDDTEKNSEEDHKENITEETTEVKEEMKDTSNTQENKVEEVQEEIQEPLAQDSNDQVTEEVQEEIQEPLAQDPLMEEDKKEEPKETMEPENKEELHPEQSPVLEDEEKGIDDIEIKEQDPVSEEVKDDTDVHIDQQYTEEPKEEHRDLVEETPVMNEEVEEKKEHKEVEDLDIENTYKENDEDIISDVEDFIMEDNKGSGNVLNLDDLGSKHDDNSGMYREDRDVDTIGIETYAGNLNIAFGSGISITLALADCKDGIKTFNINGKSIYVEYMETYCLIVYDNMQIRVPTGNAKKVG